MCCGKILNYVLCIVYRKVSVSVDLNSVAFSLKIQRCSFYSLFHLLNRCLWNTCNSPDSRLNVRNLKVGKTQFHCSEASQHQVSHGVTKVEVT